MPLFDPSLPAMVFVFTPAPFKPILLTIFLPALFSLGLA